MTGSLHAHNHTRCTDTPGCAPGSSGANTHANQRAQDRSAIAQTEAREATPTSCIPPLRRSSSNPLFPSSSMHLAKAIILMKSVKD